MICVLCDVFKLLCVQAVASQAASQVASQATVAASQAAAQASAAASQAAAQATAAASATAVAASGWVTSRFTGTVLLLLLS